MKNVIVLSTTLLALNQSKSQDKTQQAQATIGVQAQGDNAEFTMAMRGPGVELELETSKGIKFKAVATHGFIRGSSELYTLFSEKQLKGGIEVKNFTPVTAEEAAGISML